MASRIFFWSSRCINSEAVSFQADPQDQDRLSAQFLGLRRRRWQDLAQTPVNTTGELVGQAECCTEGRWCRWLDLSIVFFHCDCMFHLLTCVLQHSFRFLQRQTDLSELLAWSCLVVLKIWQCGAAVGQFLGSPDRSEAEPKMNSGCVMLASRCVSKAPPTLKLWCTHFRNRTWGGVCWPLEEVGSKLSDLNVNISPEFLWGFICPSFFIVIEYVFPRWPFPLGTGFWVLEMEVLAETRYHHLAVWFYDWSPWEPFSRTILQNGCDNERPCWLSSVCKENTCSLGRDSKYGQSGLVCWRMRNELEDFWKSQHICCKEYLWKGVLDPGYHLDSCCQGRCLTLRTQDLLARVTVMSFSAGMLTGMQTVWIQYGNVVSVDSME